MYETLYIFHITYIYFFNFSIIVKTLYETLYILFLHFKSC